MDGQELGDVSLRRLVDQHDHFFMIVGFEGGVSVSSVSTALPLVIKDSKIKTTAEAPRQGCSHCILSGLKGLIIWLFAAI